MSIRLPLFPKLRVELSSQFSCDLVHDVVAGLLDFAIATEPPLSPFLAATKVSEAPFYIVMSKDNQSAAHETVSLSALDAQEWVLFERRVHPPVYDAIMRVAQSRGVTPAQVHHVMTPEEAFPLVTQGRSVAFLTKSGALRIARDRTTLRPLAEEDLTLNTYIAARTDNKSKIAGEFMRMFVRKISQIAPPGQLPLPMNA
jgi:DNA-binding transcriptional LysR family regulator